MPLADHNQRWTDEHQDAFAALPGAERVRLLDEASAALHQLDPRPCGKRRCPVDCSPCTAAMGRGLLWLMQLPPPPPQPVLVEPAPTESTPVEHVPPERVAELLRSLRGAA